MDRYLVTIEKTVRLDMVVNAADEFDAATRLREWLPPSVTQGEPGWTETAWTVTDSVRQVDRR